MAVTLKDINYIETGEVGWQDIIDNFETLRTMPESGRCTTYVVAADDSHAQVKAQADYVCDGTADDVQIQAAIDALTAGRTSMESIYYAGGTYHLANTIYPKSFTTIVNDGLWQLDNGVNGNMIEITTVQEQINIIGGYYNGNHSNNTSGSGFYISYPTLHSGIYGDSGINLFRTNFRHFKEYGINVANDNVRTVGIYGGSCNSNQLDGIMLGGRDHYLEKVCVEGNGFAGIHIPSGGGYHSLYRDIIIGNGSLAANDLGSNVLNYGDHVKILDSYLEWGYYSGLYDAGSYLELLNSAIISNSAVGIGNSSGVTVAVASTNFNIIGSHFRDTVSKEAYHINEIGSTDTLIENCTFEDSNPASSILNITNATLRHNVGFVTENSGTATLLAAGTSIVVTHGLAVTPVAGDIIVVPMETWGNMTKFWIDTYTATQFTIHADIAPGADTDFAWKAIIL